MEYMKFVSGYKNEMYDEEEAERKEVAFWMEKEPITLDDAVRMFLEFVDGCTYQNDVEVVIHNPVFGPLVYKNYED